MVCQSGWADGGGPLDVRGQRISAAGICLQNALQMDGLPKIEPIAQFLADILGL
jgi:hypothetical protein